MVAAESVENIGKTMKCCGPALAAATTVFDYGIADSGKDRCIELVAGAAGGGGGWALAEGGAALGLATGPCAPFVVPVLAGAAALLGGFGGIELGEFVGEALCPN